MDSGFVPVPIMQNMRSVAIGDKLLVYKAEPTVKQDAPHTVAAASSDSKKCRPEPTSAGASAKKSKGRGSGSKG